jgi:hypothetical protein
LSIVQQSWPLTGFFEGYANFYRLITRIVLYSVVKIGLL